MEVHVCVRVTSRRLALSRRGHALELTSDELERSACDVARDHLVSVMEITLTVGFDLLAMAVAMASTAVKSPATSAKTQ